jgi:general secretion pathway protein N
MRILARSTASFMLALAVIAAHAAVEAAVEPAAGPGAPADEQVVPVLPSPAPLTRGNPLWAVPLANLSATRERPIFSPSRRPPARPAVAAVIEPAPPVPPMAQRPPLTLVGTIVGETTQIGVFIEENTHQMVRLHVGAGHEGWILRLVSAQGVRLENSDQAVTLTLRPADLVSAKDVEEASVTEAIPPVQH